MRRAIYTRAVFAAAFLSLPVLAQTRPEPHFDGKSWWEHVKVLADDNMEGRETGSAGLRRAQTYVVDQLMKNGLEPAGADRFYQPVKLNRRQVIEKDCFAALTRDGKSETLTPGDEVLFSSRSDSSEREISAPLAFAGYGLRIPEKQFDDLGDQNLAGKIIVYIAGSPGARQRWS
jgi:hypothetical protein